MKKEAWYKLKKGSLIRGYGKRSETRRVLRARNGIIALTVVRSGCHKLWSGQYRCIEAGVDETVYSVCDKKMFRVLRY